MRTIVFYLMFGITLLSCQTASQEDPVKQETEIQDSPSPANNGKDVKVTLDGRLNNIFELRSASIEVDK